MFAIWRLTAVCDRTLREEPVMKSTFVLTKDACIDAPAPISITGDLPEDVLHTSPFRITFVFAAGKVLCCLYDEDVVSATLKGKVRFDVTTSQTM
jgi:hypothetical protein